MIKIEKISDLRVGLSIAASWAWGTGFLIALAQIQTKGLLSFSIWCFFNTFCLTIFGFLLKKGLFNIKVWDNRYIKIISIIYQVFVYILNIYAIYTAFQSIGMPTIINYSITTIIALIVSLAMLKVGLYGCIISDAWKLTIGYVFGFTILIIALITNAERVIIASSNINTLPFALWSALLAIVNPWVDRQEWQRAYNSNPKAFYWGSFFFSFYMLISFCAAFFKFNYFMNICSTILILCLSIATLDSSFVTLLDYNFSKKSKIFIAIILSCTWFIAINMGILEVWSKIGIFRTIFAIIILIYSLYIKYKKC